MENIFNIKNVSKVYKNGVQANNDISLKINKGEIFGLFGPNGAGKTTLVKQITTLIKPTSGSIELFGKELYKNIPLAINNISYLGQATAAFATYRFEDVILHAGMHRGLSKSETIAQTNYLIDRFKMQEKRKRLRYQLSGGERKLSMLLATFIANNPILILDEPTNQLDPTMRSMVWNYLLELNQKNNTTIVLVTHNVVEAESVINRVAIIDKGKVCANGTLGELKKQVSDEVKIIVAFKDQVDLSTLNIIHKQIQKNKYCVFTDSINMPNVFNSLVNAVGLDRIDDFRVTTPTLADVYTKLTRREWDGKQ